MKIGGLQPVTLLDYPQKLAAIIFTSGCNMRCPFCYNYKLVLPELIKDDTLYNERQVIEFLKKRKKYLDGVVISGGEPLMQDGLLEFLREMKSVGYDIKLDTNGLDHDKLKEILAEKLIDYIAMDIKGPLDNYQKFSGISSENIIDSIKLVMKSGLPYEFRSTVVKNLHAKDDIIKMAQTIKGAKLYYLQNYADNSPLAGAKFRGRKFSEADMAELRDSAGEYVKKCIIR